MTPVVQGRFCSTCHKTVTDFSLLTDREIIAYLSKHGNDNQCGKFHASQLGRAINLEPGNMIGRSLLQRATALFLFFQTATSAVWAQAAKNVWHQEQTTPETKQQQKREVCGYVTDQITGDMLTHMQVSIKGSEINTLTDSMGYFSLQLPESFKDDSITIEATYTPASGPEPRGTLIPEQIFSIGKTATNNMITVYRYPSDWRDGGVTYGETKPLIEHFGSINVTNEVQSMKPNFSIY